MTEPIENPSSGASAESKPANESAPAKPKLPGRKWQPPPPKPFPKALLYLIILVASGVVLAIAVLTTKVATPPIEADVPQLAAEFSDVHNNYSIRPPINWHIEDPHDNTNLYIKGPKEKGFPPIVIINVDIKPGGLASYLNEHKGRIAYQDKSVKWVSDSAHEMDESIDGAPATARLVYDCELPISDVYPQYANQNAVDDEGKPLPKTVKVRTLQYIMEDRPRFYRVTCHVAADVFDKYLPRFEACARSFRRLPLPKRPPAFVQ